MPRRAKTKPPKPEVRQIDLYQETVLDNLFLIPNLRFLRFIGYKPSSESIRIHNEIAQRRGLPMIDEETLAYIEGE